MWRHCNVLYEVNITQGNVIPPRDTASHWRHNGRGSVSNHQPHDCLLNRLFRRRSKKTSKLRVTGLCVGNSPHKWPVTRKMFPFDDVIMGCLVAEQLQLLGSHVCKIISAIQGYIPIFLLFWHRSNIGLVKKMSRSQYYLECGHFVGLLFPFSGQLNLAQLWLNASYMYQNCPSSADALLQLLFLFHCKGLVKC